MHKDPKVRARYLSEYRESHRTHKREYDKNFGSEHKRVYTNSGGEWKCTLCGAVRKDGVELHIHHKDQDRTNNTPSNLVCLCRTCHMTVHNNWQHLVSRLINDGIVDWRGSQNAKP